MAEGEDRICGYYAVLPRPMLFRGRPVRVALASRFVVDTDQRYSPAIRQGDAFLSRLEGEW